ncbi:hypothetical protein [Peribacillus simplex]|uniref:hypothetical protein n=1 Tax=Peribacillus simplex TaxID=1478 RepID=UPI003D29A1A3
MVKTYFSISIEIQPEPVDNSKMNYRYFDESSIERHYMRIKFINELNALNTKRYYTKVGLGMQVA